MQVGGHVPIAKLDARYQFTAAAKGRTQLFFKDDIKTA